MITNNIRNNALALIIALATASITRYTSANVTNVGENIVAKRIENLLANPQKDDINWQNKVKAQLDDLKSFGNPATVRHLAGKYDAILKGQKTSTITAHSFVATPREKDSGKEGRKEAQKAAKKAARSAAREQARKNAELMEHVKVVNKSLKALKQCLETQYSRKLKIKLLEVANASIEQLRLLNPHLADGSKARLDYIIAHAPKYATSARSSMRMRGIDFTRHVEVKADVAITMLEATDVALKQKPAKVNDLMLTVSAELIDELKTLDAETGLLVQGLYEHIIWEHELTKHFPELDTSLQDND